MTKITRPDKNVQAFASTAQAGERYIFGDPSTTSDDLTDNLNTNFTRGWAAGLDPVNGYPPMSWFNAQMFTTSGLASYLFQRGGVSEWNINQEYYHPAIVFGSDNKLYTSVQDNIGIDPTTDGDTNWVPISAKNILYLSSSGSYIKPNGLAFAIVKVVGGGGSGGANNTPRFGSGGGGAGVSVKKYLASDLAASTPYTIGAGGPSSSATSGNNGGSSTFLSQVGSGGGSLANQGGPSGSGSGGDYNYGLGDGHNGGTNIGGNGGGAGGVGGAGLTASDGKAPGAGGGGCTIGGNSGAGANGQIIIEEYF